MEVQGKTNFVAQFEVDAWVQRLSYISDIFDELNKYNLKGREAHILLFSDTLRSLVSKIENWRRKTSEDHVIMFE